MSARDSTVHVSVRRFAASLTTGGRGGTPVLATRHVFMLSDKYTNTMDRRAMAQHLGHLGGRKRATRLSADSKQRIAALGGKARAESFAIARRVEQNLRYAAAMAELQPKSIAPVREAQSRRRLPGIYADEA
jgi:hypothetical protein